MRAFALPLAGLLTVLAAASAQAIPIEFAPPGVTGAVYTTNNNDGWDVARGIGFTVEAPIELTSLGLYQDFVGVSLSYGLYEIDRSGTTFTRTSTLASGSTTATTAGLEWIDVAIAPVTLTTGLDYLVEFQFTAASQQNFFYNNSNIAWSQAGFSGLDGTQVNDFTNSVVAAFRINGETGGVSDVPVPAAAPLLALALGGFALVRARRRPAA